MCGIFGVLVNEDAKLDQQDIKKILDTLFILSESRGKESAGIHYYLPKSGEAKTLKGSFSAKNMIATKDYQALFSEFGALPCIVIAHSRLVTNGSAEKVENNQPTRYGNVSMVHNGICVNVDELWSKNPDLTRNAEVDTEVLMAIANKTSSKGYNSLISSQYVFSELNGSASVAWVNDQLSSLTLATNTGDLYVADASSKGFIIFASEKFILQTTIEKVFEKQTLDLKWISPVLDQSYYRETGATCRFLLNDKNRQNTAILHHAKHRHS